MPSGTREQALDFSGRKIPLDERRAALISDLKDCPQDRLDALRFRAASLIESLRVTHAKQVAAGMPVTTETLRKNLARPTLELECIDTVLSERSRP